MSIDKGKGRAVHDPKVVRVVVLGGLVLPAIDEVDSFCSGEQEEQEECDDEEEYLGGQHCLHICPPCTPPGN